jgi:hypothetical protein
MRKRLTYANVMSTIAVFLAVGLGGAWAADKLKKNSVSSKQVKNSSILSKDLKDGKAVTGADVKDESLGASDIQGFDPAQAQKALLLGNGGEGDCLWTTLPGFSAEPPGSRKDALGEVQLNGIVAAADGPGGDGSCDLAPTPDSVQDLTIFTLPEDQRPVDTKAFLGGPSSSLIVAGVNGAISAGVQIPPGAVIGQSTGPTPVVLDGASFPAASAPIAQSAAGKPDRIDPALLGLDG